MLVDMEASSKELRQAKVFMIEHRPAANPQKKQTPSGAKHQTILLKSYSKFKPAQARGPHTPEEQQQLYIGPSGIKGARKDL